MNREIKFRAWDGTKMIYTGDKVYPTHFNNILKSLTEPCKVYHDMVEIWVCESRLSNATEGNFDHPNYIPCKAFMQYTGLPDKNGKEIYEADILDSEEGQWEVHFSNGKFCLAVVGQISLAALGIPDKKSEYLLEDWNKTCEVIGNIYQHPELLKNI